MDQTQKPPRRKDAAAAPSAEAAAIRAIVAFLIAAGPWPSGAMDELARARTAADRLVG